MFGYLGTALVLWGVHLLGQRRTVGWLVAGLGDMLWVTHGVLRHDPAIIICDLLFLALRMRAWRKWRKTS